MLQFILIVCLIDLQGCGEGEVEHDEGGMLTQSVVNCTVSSVRYPTTEREFNHLYAGRGFLADDVHIGRDILLGEGTAIYPIACGTIRVYRAAQGYGTLVVVIEHHLPSPITVTNGIGVQVSVQDFLSIYGHLRSTTLRTGGVRLPWHEGDTVRPEQIIGYVQNAADNGDGEEHLHLGIRLQTAADAARVDPSAWFAGYDSARTRRRWYADAGIFMPALLHRTTTVSMATWHPVGTVLSIDGQTWLVASEGVMARLPEDVLQDERFGARIVSGVPAELACMTTSGLSFDRTNSHRLVRFDGSSTVYEYTEAPSPLRYTFLAQQAFDSWGWQNSQVEVRAMGERMAFLARYRDLGSRRLREGSLVKVAGRSDVYVVSQGVRRPIFDWPTFLALGYDEAWISEVDPSVLEVLAGPLGEVIHPEDPRRCQSMSTSLRGTGGTTTDVSAGVDVLVDATIDGPLPDVMVYPDTGSQMLDAGVSLTDAVRDVRTDIGQYVGPEDEMDATSMLSDAGVSTMDIDTPDVGTSVGIDASVDASDAPPMAGISIAGAVMRYEFRMTTDSEGWRPAEPYYLRDHWWERLSCLNAVGSDPMRMVAQGDGWYRCDTADVYRVFVGTFFSPSHPTSGDAGHIPTIDVWPTRCYARPGAEWRITQLPSGREIYRGSASGLPCVNEGTTSRHGLP